MGLTFTEDEIKKICDILGQESKAFENAWSWKIIDKETQKPLVITLHNNVEIDGGQGSIISAQTQHGYYELHNITHHMFFEPDEIIFINANQTHLSCMIVGRKASCSVFSNISREILNADFAELNPALLLSAMQLSITENIIS